MRNGDDVEPLAQPVQWALRAGLIASGLLLATGLVLGGLRGDVGDAGHSVSIRQVFDQAVRGNSRGLLNAGLLILMLTPVFRVLVLTVGWAMSRRWRFALASAVVLGLLATSLWLGTG